MPALSQLNDLLATPEPAELGPGPRPGVQPQSALEAKLAEVLSQANISKENRELIRALILLWHDHLDAAHILAQDIDTGDGAFVHGIMHRREPDYSNAKYWFRRVGDHAAFPQLADRASTLLHRPAEHSLLERLVPKGTWDAFAFIDLCQEAAARPTYSAALREIQRLETEVLLERFST
jgi:hypothetical protein